ncbi:MAG: ABC-2 type transport system ATP-binding protein [Akkermansiaceae bacterium]|jgi:ABC-2 type transport system ATP-binding protein
MNEMVKFMEVKKRFGKVSALSGASFSIPAGSVTALLGANGAGKSTALKMMVGLEKPSTGHVVVLDQESRKIGPRELARIGYVAEGMELPDWMTVGELMDWCRPMYPEWDRALEKKLGQLFLLPLDRKLKNLSRGQRMKAALWSVLSYRPELLILDEPFSGLDPVVRDDLTRSVLELAESEKWAVVIATHDLGEVENLADRVVVMRYGKVELEGDREEMLEKWRRVEFLVPDDWEEPEMYPREWLRVERMGKVLRFYESEFGSGFEEKMVEVLPGLGEPMVERISLRDLLVVLVKSGRVEVGA